MAVPATSREIIGNSLLDALPDEELDRLLPYMECIQLTVGDVLQTPGDAIRNVYFPHHAAISLLSPTESGATAEAALVSSEGMVGLPLFLGSESAINQAVVLIAGTATRVKAQTFSDEFCESRLFRAFLRRYTNALLSETSRISVCVQLHPVYRRLARWLLLLQDWIGAEHFKLTHEVIGEMLGVRREGITGAAIKLQQRGFIRYRHGRINIVDRAGLASAACECYELIKSDFDQLHIANLSEKVVAAQSDNNRSSRLRKGEEYERALETLREINSQLIVAGIREQEARLEAEEANRAKDEFLATLSHELRTPLTAMLGWSRILRVKKFDNPDVNHALEVIESNATAQERLIEDMLDISRIVSGKLRLNIRTVDLNSVIEAAIETARPAAESSNVQIIGELVAKDPLVSGDPSRLEQVLGNLLSNAIKFTPGGGTITVRSEPIGDSFVAVSVRDTGRGIEPKLLSHVFERFRQLESGLSYQGGLGLGLAIARHLVELHHGTISANSGGHDQGATFTVTMRLLQKVEPVEH